MQRNIEHTISSFAIDKRLRKRYLFARQPVRFIPLTPTHRKHRFQWCQEHRIEQISNGIEHSLWMRAALV